MALYPSLSISSIFGSKKPSPAVKPIKRILNVSDSEARQRMQVQLSLETGVDLDILCFHRTGSAYVCDPPVTDTDDDYVILVDSISESCSRLDAQGFRHCSRYPNMNGKFLAMRFGNINFIITSDHMYYLRYVSATELSKIMNLKEKEDRINLFHAILDEEHYYTKRTLPLI